MKKYLSIIIKIILIILIISWIAIVFIDYFNAREEKTAYFCLTVENKFYNDGDVKICNGIGYKVIYYNRKSINAVEFGPFFIKEKNAE